MPDRNEEYYLEDIVFQVEDQLFKVHRRLFVKLSLVFHDMFIRAEADGLTEAQPLVLRGVEKKDFIPLLRCLYPMQFPANSNFSLTLEEWQSVLKLASLYDMIDVKTLVIEKMEPLLINLPSLQIHLAKTYNIQKWLAPALYRLTQRAKPLDEEDARLVGLSDSLKICALREKLRRCEKYGAGIRSGGFGLKEIGHAFDIRDSDLLSSVLGCEQNCTCSKAKAEVRRRRKGRPIATKHTNCGRPTKSTKTKAGGRGRGVIPLARPKGVSRALARGQGCSSSRAGDIPCIRADTTAQAG